MQSDLLFVPFISRSQADGPKAYSIFAAYWRPRNKSCQLKTPPQHYPTLQQHLSCCILSSALLVGNSDGTISRPILKAAQSPSKGPPGPRCWWWEVAEPGHVCQVELRASECLQAAETWPGDVKEMEFAPSPAHRSWLNQGRASPSSRRQPKVFP